MAKPDNGGAAGRQRRAAHKRLKANKAAKRPKPAPRLSFTEYERQKKMARFRADPTGIGYATAAALLLGGALARSEASS